MHAECRHLLADTGVYANTLPNGAMYRASFWAALTSRRRVIPALQRPARADLRELVMLAAGAENSWCASTSARTSERMGSAIHA